VTASISRAGADRLDDLRPLFLALHEHHRHVTPRPIPLIDSDDAAWEARRAAYAAGGRFAGREAKPALP